MKRGLRTKDSFHMACAVSAEADHFITVDKGILKKAIDGIKVVSPVEFICLTEGSL